MVCVVAAAVLLMACVYIWLPEAWRAPVLGVSELVGATIALLGVPFLILQFFGLKDRLVSGSILQRLVENHLAKCVEEWFPVDQNKGRHKGKIQVQIVYDENPDWSALVAKNQGTSLGVWPEKDDHFIHGGTAQIRAPFPDSSVRLLCWSRSQRFNKQDALDLAKKLASMECTLNRDIVALLQEKG